MHHESDSLLALLRLFPSHIRLFGTNHCFGSPDLGSYRSSLAFDLSLPCAVCLETKPEIRSGAYFHFIRGEGLGSHASCQVTAVCLFENI